MYIQRLSELANKGVLTELEVEELLKNKQLDSDGRVLGGFSLSKTVKYDFQGDFFNKPPLEILLNYAVPPLGSEIYDDLFKTYGYTMCGICDGWKWFRADTITDIARSNGYKPVEEATETELWKMIALCSRYWECQYKDWYEYKN